MASSSSGFSASLAVTRKSATLNVLDIDPQRNPGTVHAVSRGVKARVPATLMRSREAVAIRVECRDRKHRKETRMYRKIAIVLILACLTAPTIFAQKYPEGIWQGYDGEWKHVSQQLVALADATPADKFAWRPAPGVRSTGEVYMHIVEANFYLLSVTGPKMPADLPEDAGKKITSKAEVIAWLKRSLEAVREAHLAEKPK